MKPFLAGKRNMDSVALHAPHVHKPAPLAGAVTPAPEGPVVEVVKQGDKVMRIIVTCSCGEKIEVDCLYPAGG
jgi:hypothetical protein